MDAMLPETKFSNKKYHLDFFFRPADELAGDLYGMESTEKRLMFWLCDVTGHGIASSMVAGVIREAMARCRVETIFNNEKPDPALALNIVCKEVGRSIKGKFFATMSLAVIDFESNELTLSSAAHMKPLHFKQDKWLKQTVGKIKNGPLIGYLENSVSTYENFSMSLKEGEILFIYTDGLNEAAETPQSEQYGKRRVLRFLQKNIENPNVLSDLFDDVIKFQKKEELDDDITMAILRTK